MYCIKCGVELSSGQKKCPLCETEVYHPDFIAEDSDTYPKNDTAPDKFEQKGLMFIITIIFAIPLLLCLICDLTINGEVLWSGYAIGAILLAYITVALPFWFRHPNPVIFVPCDFAGALVYLLYIDLQTQGGWFMSFAFPTVGMIAIITTTVLAVNRYAKRGYLYTFGGALIATGLATVLLEYLICITFYSAVSFVWSIYPLVSFFLIGMMLIVIAICKPLRQSLKKKFFL